MGYLTRRSGDETIKAVLGNRKGRDSEANHGRGD